MIGDIAELDEQFLVDLQKRLTERDRWLLRGHFVAMIQWTNQLQQQQCVEESNHALGDIAILIDKAMQVEGAYAIACVMLLQSEDLDSIICGTKNWMQFFNLPIPPERVLINKPVRSTSHNLRIRVPKTTSWDMIRV